MRRNTGAECTANFVHSVIYEPIQIVNAMRFVRKVRVVEILKRESLWTISIINHHRRIHAAGIFIFSFSLLENGCRLNNICRLQSHFRVAIWKMRGDTVCEAQTFSKPLDMESRAKFYSIPISSRKVRKITQHAR